MAELYDVDVRTANYHFAQIFEYDELQESATVRKISIVQMEGDREVNRPQMLYNLDAIIAVGYRVNSYRRLTVYIIVTHSTTIEGSTVTKIEKQLLFDEGIAAKGRSLTEQMMNIKTYYHY